jgi:hypothetical protein
MCCFTDQLAWRNAVGADSVVVQLIGVRDLDAVGGDWVDRHGLGFGASDQRATRKQSATVFLDSSARDSQWDI